MSHEITVETHARDADDQRLVEDAREATETAFDPDRWGGAHLVGAAVRTADDSVYTGVSLPASVGRASMCAEPVAFGAAVADGATAFDAVVAVRHPLPEEDRGFEVVPPCGACRELVVDYGEDIAVVVPHEGERRTARAAALLPTRNW